MYAKSQRVGVLYFLVETEQYGAILRRLLSNWILTRMSQPNLTYQSGAPGIKAAYAILQHGKCHQTLLDPEATRCGGFHGRLFVLLYGCPPPGRFHTFRLGVFWKMLLI